MAHTDSSQSGKEALASNKSIEQATLFGTLAHLWPYIWPSDRADLKMRVVWSVVLLLIAKLATLSVPFTFKWATDALTGANTAPVQASNWKMWLVASPLIMTASYGAIRVLMAVLTQWRDGIFARVAMHAVRKLAYITFVHMHELSLRFHLERKTGGLTRVLERGRLGIEVIVRMVILQLVPTIVEVSLLMAVLLWQFDWRYVLAMMITVVIFMYFTYAATEWRIEIRRKMNDSDTDANTKAIDSLLNYETVKYFGAEEREAARYDRSMQRYEQNSVKSYTSLALLNTGQAAIFTAGLTATMMMCAFGVRNGHNTVGDFVMINAMMIQLYQPLNFMGMLYREIKQAIIDIEKMFNVLARNPEIRDAADARPLVVTSGNLRFEDVRFSYDPERQILKGLSFEVPAGKMVAIVGPGGAGSGNARRRTRADPVGRREAARCDRAHGADASADPGAGRSNVDTRQPHRARKPGGSRSGVAQSHLAGDRTPALHRCRCRGDHRARSGPYRRARNTRRAFGDRRPLCQYVEQAARGRGGAREAGADCGRE